MDANRGSLDDGRPAGRTLPASPGRSESMFFRGRAGRVMKQKRPGLGRRFRVESESMIFFQDPDPWATLRKISITIDAWTSPNKLAILSIISYFVTSDWRLAEMQLGFEQIQGEHNGENLAAVIMDVLHRYRIDDGRHLGITTDNTSSNFTTSDSLQVALKLIGVKWSAWNNHMPCMA